MLFEGLEPRVWTGTFGSGNLPSVVEAHTEALIIGPFSVPAPTAYCHCVGWWWLVGVL